MRSFSPGGVLGKLLPEIPKSYIRSSSPGGVLGKILPEVPKSSMRSSSPWGGGVFFAQEYPILCDFDKIFTLDIAPASQIYDCLKLQ